MLAWVRAAPAEVSGRTESSDARDAPFYAQPGARVTNARHLGSLMTLDTPREPTPVEAYEHLIERVGQWRAAGFKKRTMRQARGEAPAKPELTDFQAGIEKARKHLRAEGLPEGQP